MAAIGEPDETLMARTADGDRACLELLVRRHATPLLTFLARMAGDRHRGEELFQEVFLAVWVKRRQYQHPRPFKPWLYAIAVNKCRAAFRLAAGVVGAADRRRPDGRRRLAGRRPRGRRDRRPRRPRRGPAPGTTTRRRHAARLEGLSYARIAEIVDCTEATVRSHMHHGLAALRKQLEHKLARFEC